VRQVSVINDWLTRDYASCTFATDIAAGASVGRKPVARFAHVEWDAVTFAPGSLYAAGYLNGTSTPVAEQWVNTTGAPAALRISIKDGVGSTLYAGCADAGAC